MQWNPAIFRWLLYVAKALSAILLVITVALWLISERYSHRTGSPILTLAQWGDGASRNQRTILLGFGDIDYNTAWDVRPWPPNTQGFYDYNYRFLGFWLYQDHIRPLDKNNRPMPGVLGRSRGFSVPLG